MCLWCAGAAPTPCALCNTDELCAATCGGSRSSRLKALDLTDTIPLRPKTPPGGHYALLLGINVVSTVCCWALGGLALLDNRRGRELVPLDGDGDEGSDNDARIPAGVLEGSKDAGDLPVKAAELPAAAV